MGRVMLTPSHPYYELTRAVGKELALAGFATITGGGPGIMEAANRGAFESGGIIESRGTEHRDGRA